jgi:hypothetical protein
MFVLVLNQNNIVPDGLNSELLYKFPNSVVFKDKYLAVSSVSMFYSWFNILVTANNNNFSYTWTDNLGVVTTYQVVIPDGLYEIADINNYIQFTCIKNGTFWTLGGFNYYPFEMIVNPNRYAIQINTYLIPNALPVGATIPPNFPGWPNVICNTVVTIPLNFNQIIGYSSGFATNGNVGDAYIPPAAVLNTNFVAKNSLGTLSYLSNVSPQVQPNSNVLFNISNINNPYSQPSSVIYSLSPNVAIGSQINETPPNFMWNKLIDGTYNELRLSLKGVNGQRLAIQDPNMTILLTIKDKVDVSST